MCRTYYDVSNADEFREKIGQKRRVSVILTICVVLTDYTGTETFAKEPRLAKLLRVLKLSPV